MKNIDSILQWIKRNIKDKYIAEAIAWLVIVVVTVPICVASAFVFFRADDFAEGILTASDRNNNFIELFWKSILYAKEIYFTWMGTYFSKFMQMLLHPVNTGKGLMQLRLVMVGNTILFLASFGLFLYALVKENVEKRHLRIWLVTCGYIGMLGFQTWYEALYWYSGALCYSLPISIFFLAFFIILLEKKESKIRNIIIGILLFCGAGGNLAVVGVGCWLLIIVIFMKVFRQKFKWKYLILFGVTLVGAFINVAAPGNYVRQMSHDSGVHYIRAVVWSFDFMVRNIQWLFLETPFLLLVIIAFLIGVIEGRNKKLDGAYVKIMMALNIVAPWIVGYPICLGYSANVGLKNRCQFVIICVIVLCVINSAVLLGEIISFRVSNILIGEIIISAFLLAIFMPNYRSGWTWNSMVSYRTLIELTDGSIQEYYRDVNRILDRIENDENEDVFVSEVPAQIDVFEVMVFPEDPNHFMNIVMADYFNKKSIQGVSSPVYYGEDKTYIRISKDSFEEELSYVTIVNAWDDNIVRIQVLEPLNKNLVIEVPEGQTGKVGIYVYADAGGKECILQREIEY